MMTMKIVILISLKHLNKLFQHLKISTL